MGAAVDMVWDCCLAAPSALELEKGHQVMMDICRRKALLEKLGTQNGSGNRQELKWA